jgi:hypothetical protein
MIYLRYCLSILTGETNENDKITVTIAGTWDETQTWAHVNVKGIKHLAAMFSSIYDRIPSSPSKVQISNKQQTPWL